MTTQENSFNNCNICQKSIENEDKNEFENNFS